jgi:mRNA-degrading endonuclease toxin of MazEF toxin-antitoxin module
VLVVSNEDFNQHAGLASVVPLTSARRAAQPWEVLIPAATAGLPRDSLALIAQIRTISQERFRPPAYGRLEDRGLRLTIARLVVEHFDFDDLDALGSEP